MENGSGGMLVSRESDPKYNKLYEKVFGVNAVPYASDYEALADYAEQKRFEPNVDWAYFGSIAWYCRMMVGLHRRVIGYALV